MKRASRRGAPGALAASLFAVLLSAGCQDGYPVEATPCDQYCNIGLALRCPTYSPAGCVVACEGFTGGSGRVCPAEFRDWVGCLSKEETGYVCDYSFPLTAPDCDGAFQPLRACAETHRIYL